MTAQVYALQIHNDDVTPMEDVVALLCEIGLPKPEAGELMVAVHSWGVYPVAFGAKDDIAARHAKMQKGIASRGLDLRIEIIGPLDANAEEVWRAERHAQIWPSRRAWIFGLIAGVVLGVLLWLLINRLI
ncbi:MAG: ATP-dependent Clp protease adaptor ClpS [Pseudomonadota bacterium]